MGIGGGQKSTQSNRKNATTVIKGAAFNYLFARIRIHRAIEG